MSEVLPTPRTITRALKLKIRTPPVAQRKLLRAMSHDLTCAANRALTEAFSYHVLAQVSTIEVPNPRSRAYQLGRTYGWQGALVRDTVNAAIQAQVSKRRLRAVESGERSLASFRALPLVFRAENLVIAEDGSMALRLQPSRREPLQPFEAFLVPVVAAAGRNNNRANTRAHARDRAVKALGRSNVRSVNLYERDGEWFASIVHETRPLEKTGHRYAGIDIGARTAFWVAVGELTEEGPELIRSYPVRFDRELQSRAWKYREQRRRGSKLKGYFRHRDQAFDQIVHRLVHRLRSQNVGTVFVEDLRGLSKAWGHREAVQFLPGDMYGTKDAPGRFIQACEAAGIEVIRVSPHRTSTTCSTCGEWLDPKKHTDPAGYGRHKEHFRCPCGVRMNADRNAAINVATAGVTADGARLRLMGPDGRAVPGCNEGAAASAAQDALGIPNGRERGSGAKAPRTTRGPKSGRFRKDAGQRSMPLGGTTQPTADRSQAAPKAKAKRGRIA